MTHRFAIIGCAVVLSAAAPKAAAVTPTQNTDAFDLAAAFAPSPSPATVTGLFTEASNSAQLGTFIDGIGTIGFGSGIILSTGNINEITLSASGLSTDYSGTPAAATEDLIDLIPGLSGTFTDTVRFSLEINPGVLANFVNFSLGYMTNEISPSDRFGIFVDGDYVGYIVGQPLDQGHSWLNAAVPSIGCSQAFYADGNPLNSPFATISIAVPNPGSTFSLDFVLVDVFDGASDSAVFLGELSATETALGTVAVPEPGTATLLALSALGFLARRTRCTRQNA